MILRTISLAHTFRFIQGCKRRIFVKKSIVLALALVVVGALLLVGVVAAQGGNVSRGARLYDKWWAELGVDVPAGDQPL